MQLNRRTFAASTVAAMASTTAVSALAQSTPTASPVASPVADLQAKLLGVMEQHGTPGAVIGMTMPGEEPVIMELGVSNLETGAPMSADMHFRIGSVTKPFVASVVLQLVDEGLLTLDQTINEVLPEITIVNSDIVTVRNLLQMRSGLPQLTSNPEFLDIYLGDPNSVVEVEQILALVADLPAAAEPDTTFDYNNVNYDILGEMIRTLTGTTWHENVATRIVEPLGLTNTLMTDVPEMPTPAPVGYGYLDQEVPEELRGATPEAMATPIPDAAATPAAEPVNDAGAYDVTLFNPTVAGAAGGMISTVNDQMVWANALVNGELVSPELYAEQIEFQPLDETGNAGYGFGLMDLGGFYGHNGAVNGFQSVVGGVPEVGLSVVVLTNCHPTLGLGDAAVDLLITLLSN